MVAEGQQQTVETPFSRLAVARIREHYFELGCDRWNYSRVLLLCAKYGDTPTIMAARIRLTPSEFNRRLTRDNWSKQDGLIFTMLEHTIEAIKGNGRTRLMVPPTS